MASRSPAGRGTPGRPNAHQSQLADNSTDLASELDAILTLGDLGLAESLYTGWRFYLNTLIDNSNTYTFTLNRADVATHVGTDGYLKEVAAHVARYESPAGGGGALGLLHEDLQTNLHTYSNKLETGWTYNNVTRTDDSGVTGMTGDASASKFAVTAGTGTARARQAVSITSGNHYVASIYLKYGFYTDGSNTSSLVIDMTPDSYITLTWSVGGVPSLNSQSAVNAYGIEEQAGGWYRVWINFTANVTGSQNMSYYVDGGASATDDYVYMECCQFEQVPYADSPPTSWIPTTSASEDRAKDTFQLNSAVMPVDINTGVTIYIEARQDRGTWASGGVSEHFFHFNDNSESKNFLYRTNGSASTFVLMNYPYDAGVDNISGTVAEYANTMHKVAVAVEDARQTLYIEGAKPLTDDSRAITTTTWDTENIEIGATWQGVQPAYRLIMRELRIYDSALSDSELAELTT